MFFFINLNLQSRCNWFIHHISLISVVLSTISSVGICYVHAGTEVMVSIDLWCFATCPFVTKVTNAVRLADISSFRLGWLSLWSFYAIGEWYLKGEMDYLLTWIHLKMSSIMGGNSENQNRGILFGFAATYISIQIWISIAKGLKNLLYWVRITVERKYYPLRTRFHVNTHVAVDMCVLFVVWDSYTPILLLWSLKCLLLAIKKYFPFLSKILLKIILNKKVTFKVLNPFLCHVPQN